MPGFLDGYGVVDAKREKSIKRLVLTVAVVAILSAVLYFQFRDHSQERQLALFLDAVKRQDFKTAYTYWGCTVEVQCRDYMFDKFLEDWGPTGSNVKAVNGKLRDVERCGTGLLGDLHNAGAEDVALWVDRSTNIISYAPWQQCPEKRIRLMRWLRMHFSHG
ncbi:MAG: hypothetical protein HYZ37_14200 [Candidatus Solibacter usitatus]|nr:hypothetical protein [Candidatus Solibacter usitatus]